MSRTLTILGCGSSGGVPRIGGDWGLCDPANPKNRRRRCSVLLTQTGAEGQTRVLVDTSPDLREQMLSANIAELDGVLFTHEHADHTHGIDDLRAFYLRSRRRVPIWADEATGSMLTSRFTYCFYTAPGSDYPHILDLNRIAIGQTIMVNGAGGIVEAEPFKVHHGVIDALGFRFGATAYTPDLNAIPPESVGALEGLDLWIVDALKRDRHGSHFSLPETLIWIDRLKPKRAIITNMHIDMDYNRLCGELPKTVEPAYDGMEITIR